MGFETMSKEEHLALSAKGGRTPRKLDALVLGEARRVLFGEGDEKEKPFRQLCAALHKEACVGNVRAAELLMKLAGVNVDRLGDYAPPGDVDAEAPRRLAHIHTFLDFRNTQGGLCFLYGTTRSGKTYAAVQWFLSRLADGTIKGSALIAGQTLPFLRNGVAQYIRALAPLYPGVEVMNNGLEARKGNASIVVQSFEKPERALSAQWDLVFLNEGNVLPREVVDQLRPRTSGLIVCDFNPSTADWWGASDMTEANSLFCTFANNPFLSDAQLAHIEDIRAKGEGAPLGSYARWFYEVYYLGQFSEVGGGVFLDVRMLSVEDWQSATSALVTAWGVDFGDTTDPNALVQVGVDAEAHAVYVRCVYYATATDDLAMVEVLKAHAVDRLVFETATGGNTRARNFKSLGFQGRVIPAEKESVAQSVFNLSSWRIYCCDEHSRREFSGYRLAEGRFKGPDHVIDAVRYVFHLIMTNKIR